jgi:phosphoenolpyruvate synthase/pyruvate phosphate dikinase
MPAKPNFIMALSDPAADLAFVGQQETYLHIQGVSVLLKAVQLSRNCLFAVPTSARWL